MNTELTRKRDASGSARHGGGGPRAYIETHGCKLNLADSQRIARDLQGVGFEISRDPDQSPPDVYILDSCTVTHVADRKARKSLSAARRRFPEALVVATGCYAQQDPETVAALHSVDLVVTNERKHTLAEEVSRRLGVNLSACAEGTPTDRASGLLGRTRAALKIQEGCDQVCAYCIVPRVRGRERSVPGDYLVRQVNRLVEEDCKEVVLTGTQLGSYGFDLPDINLSGMLRRLLDETSMPRIRVSSLQPAEITDELLSLWNAEGKGRLCPHFHIPLQSGSDAVLKRMRRRYTSAEFLDAVERVREAVPEVSITSDVIAGFPGESPDDHAATLEVVARARFSGAHVFPYSTRPGTSAAHFGGHVPPETRAERAAEIRTLAEADATGFRHASVGEVRPVLWESGHPSTGLTDNYLKVRLAGEWDGTRTLENRIEHVRLSGVDGDVLTAERAQ